MKTKKYILWAVIIFILTIPIAVRADAYDEVRIAQENYSKVLEENNRAENIMHIINIIFDIVCILFLIFIAYPAIKSCLKSWEEEKRKQKDDFRNIVHTELEKAIGVTPKLEICENCGRAIGKLEKSYVFEEHRVCGECYQRLKSQK
jgi:hypothetical protein